MINYNSRVMEAESISKNAARLKSLMSRGNFIEVRINCLDRDIKYERK
jgi:hypothetical protein